MSVAASDTRHHSTVEAMMSWLKQRLKTSELSQLDAAEFEGLARDLGVSGATLRELAQKPPTNADEMRRQMALRGIDLNDLMRHYGGAIRDLEVVCSRCGEKKLCRHDLAEGASEETFDQYCPNAEAMKALAAF